MSEKNFNTFQDSANGEIDFAKFMRYVLVQSKMILLFTFIAFILSVSYYLSSTKIYKVYSLLQVESFNQNSLDPTNTLQMMSPLRSSADIDNLVKLYKSRTNLLQMIGDLNLNVDINDISDQEMVDIVFFYNDIDDLPNQNTFYILPAQDTFKIFSDKGKNLLIEANYGQEVKIFDEFIFKVESVDLETDRLLEINYKNPVLVYPVFKNRFNVNSTLARNAYARSEGLIEISLFTDDINQGKRIVDYANKIFINQRVAAGTEKSRAAIEFIDDNLTGLEKTVSRNKDKLKEFRELNKSIDLDQETRVIIDTVQSIDESLNEIEVELANASKIYTTNNPLYVNLLNKKTILVNRKNDILSKIKVMPKEQQLYIDLYSQVEITQNLLAELETRRLGFSILEASTIGDIRVIDDAYVEGQIAPSLLNIPLMTFLAFLFSMVLAVIRGFSFLPITNPAEIIDNNIFEPIIGVIPFDEDIEKVDLNSDESRYKAAMESTIINIRSLQEEKDDEATIISLTSPTALNGKSTSAKKLAETFSLLNKKVLLIDADFKRGSLGKDFNKHSISEKTFFNIDSKNIEEFQISENFYLIPRVKGLINSFHFICNPSYSKIFQNLKKDFDYIIFDTAPLLSVADTSVILKFSDINILVLRHNINKIKEVKQSLDVFAQVNITMHGFIYNAFAKPTGYYGYYALYGNYAYSYYSDKYLNDSYEYRKED